MSLKILRSFSLLFWVELFQKGKGPCSLTPYQSSRFRSFAPEQSFRFAPEDNEYGFLRGRGQKKTKKFRKSVRQIRMPITLSRLDRVVGKRVRRSIETKGTLSLFHYPLRKRKRQRFLFFHSVLVLKSRFHQWSLSVSSPARKSSTEFMRERAQKESARPERLSYRYDRESGMEWIQ